MKKIIQKLWNMFNETGVLLYTSTFKEPSSRAHRQAQAAGSLVMYPPNMGTPSRVITDNETGFMRPIDTWVDTLLKLQQSDYERICNNARQLAISERWEIAAKRFNNTISKILGEKK